MAIAGPSAQEETWALEQDRVRFDDGTREIRQKCHVVCCRAQQTPVEGAVLVALHPHVGCQGVGHVAASQPVRKNISRVLIWKVELVGKKAHGTARNFLRHIVSSRPAGGDCGLPRNCEVAGQSDVLTSDDEAVVLTVIPPVHRLHDPTGEGHRHLLVALADGRRFKIGHPLLEICAAVAPEVRSFGGMSAHGEPAERHAKCGCDGDSAGCICQSPKHVHLHLFPDKIA